MEKHKASPEMQKFFTKLLDLKRHILWYIETTPENSILKELYERLDDCIKSTEEKK